MYQWKYYTQLCLTTFSKYLLVYYIIDNRQKINKQKYSSNNNKISKKKDNNKRNGMHGAPSREKQPQQAHFCSYK